MKQVAIATLNKLETVPSFTLKTDGRGLWTKEAREVQVTNIEFDSDTHEIRAFFDTKKWPVEEFGLICSRPTVPGRTRLMNTTYLDAEFNGIPVFVELSASDMYDTEKVVPVFEDRAGQLFMHDAKVGDLTILGPMKGHDKK